MARKLTDDKLARMFSAFCEKQSIRFVARKCAVSQTTCRRYRVKEEWDARLREIQRQAREAADGSEVDRRMELVRVARELQDDGLAYLRKHGYETAKGAIAAVYKGVEIERALLGLDVLAEVPGPIHLEVIEVGDDRGPSLESASRDEVLARLHEIDAKEGRTGTSGKATAPVTKPKKQIQEKEPWDD